MSSTALPTQVGPAAKACPARSGAPALMPVYASISRWGELSSMSRATTYRHLKAGKLRAIKNNSRTLIDVDHGLNFLASQPEYAPDHPARGVGRSPVAPEMVH